MASKEDKFKQINVPRRQLGEDDILIEMMYCGICHSDVHNAKDEINTTIRYPIVPGHELAGVVKEAGPGAIGEYPVGSHVGVGVIAESCLKCGLCKEGYEQMCMGEKGSWVHTYNMVPIHGYHGEPNVGYTFGGYTEYFVVNKNFAIPFPKEYPLEKAGPILCAGITLYHPIKTWGAHKGGMKVAIAGLGGLGLMGLKLAVALGNEVSVISTSENKRETALAMGAKNFIIANNEDDLKKFNMYFDLILDTVSVGHNIFGYQKLLTMRGTLVVMGLIPGESTFGVMNMLKGDRKIAGSQIGGIADTRELVKLCHEKQIYCDIELVTADRLDEVYDSLSKKNDSVKRYVLDIKKSIN